MYFAKNKMKKKSKTNRKSTKQAGNQTYLELKRTQFENQDQRVISNYYKDVDEAVERADYLRSIFRSNGRFIVLQLISLIILRKPLIRAQWRNITYKAQHTAERC